MPKSKKCAIAIGAFSLLLRTSLIAQMEIDPGNCHVDSFPGWCANEGERCMDAEYQCLHCSTISMPFGSFGCVCN